MTPIIDKDSTKKKKKPMLRQMRVDLYYCDKGLFFMIIDRNLLLGCSGITKSLSSLDYSYCYMLSITITSE